MATTAFDYFSELKDRQIKHVIDTGYDTVTFIGLDLSLTNTGFSAVKAGKYIAGREISVVGYGMERVHTLAKTILRHVEQYPNSVIGIEGYAFNVRNTSSLTGLAELGGVIKNFLYFRNHQFLTTPPMVIKKYAMGKANIEKTMMPMAVLKKFGVEAIGGDHADAVAISFLLYHSFRWYKLSQLSTVIQYTTVERECFETFLSPPKKKEHKVNKNRQLALELA